MIPVSIYVDKNCWAGSVYLIRELLAVAGPLIKNNADLRQAALFDITLVGPTMQPLPSFTGPVITPERSLRTARPAQVIVLPAFFLPPTAHPPLSTALRRWLERARDNGACILAIASGVRLLAEAGMLNGRDATGNMSDRRAFAVHYPEVRFDPDTPLVVDGQLITAASIAPAIEACAHLISRFHGEKAASKFARFTNSARQLSYDQGTLNLRSLQQHGDERVLKRSAIWNNTARTLYRRTMRRAMRHSARAR
ncbi:DJ-1/PfpI family protein [Pseudoduganella sp. RAF19]|uniref:DJ-1/PfpI family protein n=1 Tax=Pseudoduganella sp. RAF19 TaxID=3233052 RepID=UPI003F98E63B